VGYSFGVDCPASPNGIVNLRPRIHLSTLILVSQYPLIQQLLFSSYDSVEFCDFSEIIDVQKKGGRLARIS